MFYHLGSHQEQLIPLASAPHHLHEALWHLQGAMAGHVPMSLLTPTWEAAGPGEGLCISLGTTAHQDLQFKLPNLCLALNVTKTCSPGPVPAR